MLLQSLYYSVEKINQYCLFLSQVLFTGDIERCEAALYLAKRVCGAGGTHLRSLKDNH